MTKEQIERLTHAIAQISHGTDYGPMGIEALVMALVGEGGPTCRPDVASSLREIADGLHDIAEAIREVKE